MPDRRRRFAVVGTTNLARRVCAGLTERGHEVTHLARPNDQELRAALAPDLAGVAIVTHDDTMALRYAFAVRHIHVRAPIVATIFDRTIATEVRALLPGCVVASPGDLLAPSLAAACLDPDILALQTTPAGTRAVRREGGGPLTWSAWRPSRRSRWRARWGRISGQLRPHDGDARLLLTGLVGILAVLLGEWLWLASTADKDLSTAFLTAARVVAAVGPAYEHPDHALYQVVSGTAMLATITFTALLTAGMVDRLLGPRLSGVVGPRAVPRSGHVIVVGLGQVGLRVYEQLRRLGVPVVGVERQHSAPSVRMAPSLHIPIVLAHGEDRRTLERLQLERAQALVALSSNDLENVTVGVAAHAVAPHTRVVLRAGEHDAIAETRSLLRLGATQDVTRASAAYTLACLLGHTPVAVIAGRVHDLIELPAAEPTFVEWPVPAPDRCRHPGCSGSLAATRIASAAAR